MVVRQAAPLALDIHRDGEHTTYIAAVTDPTPFVRSVSMKRLSPEERKHILHQTLLRLRKDWICRYGQWNTTKLLREMRRLLRRAHEPDGLDSMDATESAASATDEDLPLFEGL